MSFSSKTKEEQFDLLKQVVDDSQSYIYVCDTKTYELLFVNDRMVALTGKPIKEAFGKTCYQYIKGADKPCNPCYITSTGKDDFTVRTYCSKSSGKSYVCRGKIIDWSGHEALIEYLTDETDRINAQQSLEDMLDNIPGGVGIYNYYNDGRVEQIYLNDGYYLLLNTNRIEREQFKGFSVIDAVYPSDVKDMLNEVKHCIKYNKRIDLDIRVLTGNSGYKWFNIKASIASKDKDKTVLYAFYSDINELKKAKLDLDSSRRAINIASETRGLAFWIFYLDEKIIVQDYLDASPLAYPRVIKNVPESILDSRTVFPEDKSSFVQHYNDIYAGKDKSSCTVRILNNRTGKYEWQQMIYTRVADDLYGKRVAIGFSANADIEQENVQKYNNELKLRQEIIKNAILYYQLNLTKGIVEEFHSNTDDENLINSGDIISEGVRQFLLANVYEQDKHLVRNNIFSPAVLKMYNEGIVTRDITYRRYISGLGLQWVRTFVNVMEKPTSHELIAFIYSLNIDKEKKNQLALDSVMMNEIETAMIVNSKTSLGRVIKIKVSLGGLIDDQLFNYDDLIERMIDKEVYPDDKIACANFFFTKKLINFLKLEKICSITYRIFDENKNIYRKKVRAFYLDEFENDIVIIRQDITDLYEEEQRQKLALETAVNEAKQASLAKSEFLSRMSHDIRTPLTAIIALSSPEMIHDIDDTERVEYLNKINISGTYLLGLINDVLDMSKIESKKVILNAEPYKFDDFSNMINTIVLDQCKQKKITFVSDFGPEHEDCVLIDKIRFNQIIINLLSNAVKFTPVGGRIDFIMQSIWSKKEQIKKRFIVKDNGIGMSKEFLPHCFETFTQENQSSQANKFQGTGLGLSIVKQMVDLMGGSITVESEIGLGTTFTVDMVFTKTILLSESTSNQTDNDSLKDVRILLCEDNIINSQIIVKMLKKKGCLIDTSSNGLEGLNYFKESRLGFYDLILMDIRMPIMDGLEATKAIRNLDRKDALTIPIIALTADAFDEDVRVAKDSGMMEHLSKPINFHELYATVGKYVRKKKGEDK